MAEIYGFEFEVAQRLKEMAGVPTQVSKARTAPLKRPPQMIGGALICFTPSGGIPARSGTTISAANCTLRTRTGTTLGTSAETIGVWNMSTSPVAGNEYVGVVLTNIGYVAFWEDC